MPSSLPMLIFHTIADQGSIVRFAPQAFARNMALLAENDYRTMPLLEVVGRLRRGQPFPPRSFVLTFDDGFRSVYQQAFPVLQHLGFAATVFLLTGDRAPRHAQERLPTYEGQAMLSWQEIREMHSCGIDFGAHTCTHRNLPGLAAGDIKREMAQPKAIIEDMLGEPVQSFAYPNGKYDARSREIAAQLFACACADTLALVTSNSDAYALERIDSYYLRPDGLFDLILSSWFPWYVRARRFTRGTKRALQSALGG
jgi:peptidoglycan/xylan/chitin deacetylase (PgdA/CDA1 family)